jgi:integral membrane protein
MATPRTKRSPLVTAYLAFAWTTGAMITILVFVAVPLKYWAHQPDLDKIVGLIHGAVLYPPYVILSIATAFVFRLSIPHMALMALAGLVPGLSPYVARRTVRQIDAKQAAKATSKTPNLVPQTAAPADSPTTR